MALLPRFRRLFQVVTDLGAGHILVYPLPFLIIILLSVVILDQVTKYIVQQNMTLHASIPVLSDYVRLTYIHNPGAAFGIMPGNRWLFLALSLVACGVMIYYFYALPADERWGRRALMGILGGAVGNLIDRVRFGEVTDFVDVGIGTYRWPVFNVADMAVTIGVAILFLRLSSLPKNEKQEQASEDQGELINSEDRTS